MTSTLRGQWMSAPPRMIHYVYDGKHSACGFKINPVFTKPYGSDAPGKKGCLMCRSIVKEAKTHEAADLQTQGHWRCMCLTCRKLREPTP